MNNREISKASPALEQIRAKGDVLDTARLYKKRRALGHIARWQTLGPVLPLAGNGFNSGVETLFTYPIYAAGLGVAAYGSYGLSRLRERRNVARAEAHQELIRNDLGEPVDVFRTSQSKGFLKRKEHQLTLRWYGADGTQGIGERREVKKRLEHIVEYSEAENIEHIMIGADWLKGTIGDEIGEKEFGELCDGVTVITDNKQSRIDVEDHYVDERVLLATPEQMQALLEKIEVEDDENQVSRLVALTKNEVVRSAYTSMQASQLTPAEFSSIVRTGLERAYEEDNPATLRAVKNSEGVPGRIKVIPSVSARGGHLHQSVGWHDEHTGDARISHDGVSDILHDHGVRTIDQLLDKLSHDENVNEKSVLSALYLLLRDNNPATRQAQTAHSGSLGDHKEATGTLFQRMHDEGRLTSRIHRASREQDGSFERYYRRRFATRALGAAGVMLASLSAGAAVGIGNSEYANYVYTKDTAGLTDYMFKQDASLDYDQIKENYFRQQGADYDLRYLKAYDAAANKDFDLSMYIAEKYVNTFGIDGFSRSMAGSLSYEWQDKAMKRLPPDMYTSANDKAFIGDAGVETNSTIYSVKSLAGDSTDGYWYGFISNEVSPAANGLTFNGPDGGQVPVDGGEVDIPQTLKIPSDQKTIDSLHPDFLVQTPYLLGGVTGLDRPLTLPVMQDTEIVGARISDLNDPTKFVSANVETYPRSGLSMMRIKDVDTLYDAGIRTPQMEYWIKKKAGTKTIHHLGSMTYDPSDVDIREVSDTVKQALGLPDNASDAQLLKAIRDSKYYSFTPFADEGKKLRINTENSSTGMLEELGTSLAKLDALNCNLAASLYILGKGGAEPNLATGYHDDGDGKLTSREAHAWLIDNNDNIIDPTPSKSKKPLPGNKPDDEKQPSPEKLPTGPDTDTRNMVGEATLGAALALLAYRRRKQLAMQATNHVLGMRNVPEAISAIQTAQFGGKGAKPLPSTYLTPEEARQAVLRNVPADERTGGISLGEVQDLLTEKEIDIKLSPRTKLAIKALHLSDRAIRNS